MPGNAPFADLPFAQGARQAQLNRDRAAVRALLYAALAVAAMLWLSVPLQALAGVPDPGAPWRLLVGVVLVAGAGGAVWINRYRAPRVAAGLLLLSLQGCFGLIAWFSHLGLLSVLLAGSAILIVVAGLLTRARVAWMMTGMHLAILAVLYHGEASGLLVPVVGPGVGSPLARLISHLMLTGGALLVAVIFGRQFGTRLHEAWVKEYRMAELLRLGSDWTWEADRKGRMTSISPAFERHTGRTVAEFLQVDQPGGPRIVRDAEWAALVEDLRARRPYRHRVITFECADGTMVCVRGTGEPMLDRNGHHMGWWGLCQNVTGEVLAAREHERSRTLLDRLVRLSPDAIAVAHLRNGRIMLANPSFLAMAGFAKPEDVLGRSALELGLWREEAQPLALAEALRASGTVRDLKTRAWRRDSTQRDILITAARFESDGQPVTVMICRDITELERSRLQGDAILNHAAVGVALVRRGRLERVNPRLEGLLGLPNGSMAGHLVADYVGSETAYRALVDQVRDCLATGRPIEVEHEFVRADGDRFLALMRSQLVDPQNPEEGGAIWVVEDITDRRRAEQALAEAKMVAEAASDAKSAFLAHMSHEIRTPLHGVLGLARLMAGPGQPPARQQQHLRYLIDAAESLNAIVSNVLDLSKMEAGKLPIEQIAFDLHDLVDKVHGALVILAETKSLVMRLTIEAGVPRRVRGDPLRLRQILSNYIANAVKFTRRGEVMLRVSVAAPDRLRFEVQDTGIGIAPEVLAGLFRPFAQADHSTTRRFGGTGLGLSITRELAQLMGGEVGARSTPGEGACFWAELPLPADSGPAGAAGLLQDGEARPLQGLRLLLAEDNPVNMLIAMELLARLGASVTPARDGAEAVQACQAHPEAYDVVLMDLHMPVLDGFAAVRSLRADSTTAALPVVAFSAAALDHERAQARDAGMDDFIGKPVQPEELVRVLGRWVR